MSLIWNVRFGPICVAPGAAGGTQGSTGRPVPFIQHRWTEWRGGSTCARSEAAQQEISGARQHLLTHRKIWQQAGNFNCPDHRRKNGKKGALFVRGSPPRHERSTRLNSSHSSISYAV